MTTLQLVPPSHGKIIQKMNMRVEVLSRKPVSAFFKCSPPPESLLWIILMVISLILLVIICATGFYIAFICFNRFKREGYEALKKTVIAVNAKLGSFKQLQSTASSKEIKEKININTSSSTPTPSSSRSPSPSSSHSSSPSSSSSSSASSYTTATSQIIKLKESN